MKRILTAIGLVLATAAPAPGQIVTPTLAPPCLAKHCPGAMTQTKPATSHYCPPGTVYQPQKGTCKVLPPAPHN